MQFGKDSYLREEPSGIGGLLVLPILGLCATVIFNVVTLVRDLIPAYSAATWPYLTAQSSFWGPFIAFETFATIVFVIAPIPLLILLFRKRRILPKLMVGFYAFNLAFLLFDAVATFAFSAPWLESLGLGSDAESARSAATRAIERGILAAAIWIPYFLRSTRVKNTFVHPLQPGEELVRIPAPEIEPPTFRRRAARAGLVIAGVIGVIAVVFALSFQAIFPPGSPDSVGQTVDAASSGTPPRPTQATGVLATIGGHQITGSEFDGRLADFEAEYADEVPDRTSQPAEYKQFQREVLEYMVVYELAVQKAAGLNLTVTEQEVQNEIDAIKSDSFGGDQAQFDEALRQQGMTLDQLKRSYAESMLLQLVYDEVTRNVGNVPDPDLASQQKNDAWRSWIEAQKLAVGVTYADGWQPNMAAQAPPG